MNPASKPQGKRVSQWDRTGDFEIVACTGVIPLPASSLAVLLGELTPIVLNIDRDDSCWKIVVTDQGQGMRSQQIEDIGAFKQFWSDADRPSGLGIGLVLVQGLVMTTITPQNEKELARLPIARMQDEPLARLVAREEAARLGFSAQATTQIATAVSEITRNVVQHAGGAHRPGNGD